MSDKEEIMQMLEAFDDSNIDYEHPIWARSIEEGFHEELRDFAAACMVRRTSRKES